MVVKISDVLLHIVKDQKHILAFAKVNFQDQFFVEGFKVVKSSNGALTVIFPEKFQCINRLFHGYLESSIIEQYAVQCS